MKLSEILKENCYTSEMSKELHSKDTCPRCKSNTALTSCDREIDKEVLKKVINDWTASCEKFELKDLIISTMPQWLKRIDNGKI